MFKGPWSTKPPGHFWEEIGLKGVPLSYTPPPSVQHKRATPSALKTPQAKLLKNVLNWGVCWTEGFLVLNWGGLCETEGYSVEGHIGVKWGQFSSIAKSSQFIE